MAAPFYARYVPPAPPASSTPKLQNLKRKKSHDDATTTPSAAPPTPKKPKKTVSAISSEAASSATQRTHRSETTSGVKSKSKKSREGANAESLQVIARAPTTARPASVPDTPSTGSFEQVNGEQEGTHDARERNDEPLPLVHRQGSESKTSSEISSTKGSREKRKSEDKLAAPKTAPPSKHAKILSKYKKHTINPQSSDAEIAALDQTQTDAAEDLHGLTPLPQPAPAVQSSELPSYATLPEWLSHPLIVSPDDRRSFAHFGLNEKQVANLERRGYSSTMPIQSAVIPLALSGEGQHKGDICISAATGSGKTLSYVLPMVSAIQPSPISHLRGLIVVPTRELVKQVRETCEFCATGTGLRIGTAVGSTALKDEQTLIMQLDQQYDPEAWDRKLNPLMTTDDWTNFNLQEYIAEAKNCDSTLPNHTLRSSPNVDILVCTPGRLVDHIRSTKGFTLKYLQWLVIDEADRLLNESFQEWTEIVIPAIESSRRSESKVNTLLKRLGVSAQRRTLRKLILSATLTRDITKLNSLRLHNPKFVEVRTADSTGKRELPQETAPIRTETYRLPPTLTENFVPVKDSSVKPLFLLQLIKSELFAGSSESRSALETGRDVSPLSSAVSDDDTSDSDSDSTSSAESTQFSSTGPLEVSSRPLRPARSALIFTKSSESASRLARLLAFLNPDFADKIGVLVKSNKSSTARKTLAAYKQGRIQIIIATDRASRGLDLPFLDHVVSYDVPMSLTSYVHRAGRTARAGHSGIAWTLVVHSEGRWFSNEIVKSPLDRGNRSVKRVILKLDDDPDLKGRYATALKQLEEEVKASQNISKRDKSVKSSIDN